MAEGLTKKELLFVLIQQLEAKKCYPSFLANRIKSSIQYTSDLLTQLKLEGKIRKSDKVSTIGSGGKMRKTFYEPVIIASEEADEVLKRGKK